MSDERTILLGDAPPPAPPDPRRRRRNLIVGGFTAAIALFAVLLLMDDGDRSTPGGTDDTGAMIDLLGPSPLDEEELAAGGLLDRTMGLELPSGGWIQVAAPDGRLAQQYRFEHLDPNPPGFAPGWIAMQHPQVEIFGSDGQVVTITGRQAHANAPHRALESGEIFGDVRIQLYEARGSRPVSVQHDEPTMTMHTTSVRFDHFLGEILCENDVRIETSTEELVGRKLRLLFNDRDQRIEFLRFEEIDYIRLRSGATISRRASGPAPAPIMALTQAPFPSGLLPAVLQVNPVPPIEPTWYLLTLEDRVRIEQGEGVPSRVALGDLLTIAFSPKSEVLTLPQVSMTPPLPRDLLLTAAAIGASDGVEGPTDPTGDTIITCEGGLTMVPLSDATRRPDSAQDILLRLTGNPVYVVDATTGTEAWGDLMTWRSTDDRIDLHGGEEGMARVRSEEMLAASSRFWSARSTGASGALGAGWLRMQTESPVPIAPGATIPIPGVAAIVPEPPPDEPGDHDPLTELQITWDDAMDLELDPGEGGLAGTLRSARFTGNVAVLADEGSIEAQRLRIDFTTDEDGKEIPDRMEAGGGVRAQNIDQTLWSDDLHVTFAPDEVDGRRRMDRLLATGDVQVLMADGIRAFADRLEGDAAQDEAVLTGTEVVIAGERLLVDHGTRVELHREQGTAHWIGPGRARILVDPVELDADERLPHPGARAKATPPAISLRASWDESMLYLSRANEGAGSIDLHGDVSVHSEPSPLERSTMTGQGLTLEFTPVEDDPETVQEDDGLDADPIRRERRLRRLIARGDAKLENRTWELEDHSDVSRVFYIGADHITYEALTMEALVVGDGVLVVRNPRPPDDDDREGLFGRVGTTRFTWERQMELTRRDEQRSDLHLEGAVEVLYKGLAEDDVGSVTAEIVDAEILRTSLAQDPDDRPAALDLGGDLDVRALRAEGTVLVATPRRRVSCDRLDYDVASSIADLRALPGGTVSVLTIGNPYPVIAERVRWNMDPAIDTVTITRAYGGGTR